MQAWLQDQLDAAFHSRQDPISNSEPFNEEEYIANVKQLVA